MAKRGGISQVQRASTASLPAPTGGLNAKDALADMPETDAIIMTNMFPNQSSVNLRNGSVTYSSGFPGWVETVAHYSAPNNNKLFGISNGNIYDATAGGAVGSAVVSGLSNSRFQFVNIGTPGGNFLTMVNGADKLRGFDGTNWWADGDGAHDISGFDTSHAIQINLFKNRLWLVQQNSLSVWYLGVQSIAGTATEINLSTLFPLGGHIVAMANWTIDNVSGINDYAVFITSEGEFAVYNGTDPSSSTTWALVGVFHVGRPVGTRCFIKVGSDVVLICEDGVFPLSKALLTDRTQINDAISNKIINLMNANVQSFKGNFGWQLMLYPLGTKLICNVPSTENNTQYQYVMNTINGSWCKFTGWDACCWEVLEDTLYYGGNQVIVIADTGTDDNGANITAQVKQAFSYFKSPGKQKLFTMCRPIFATEGNINAAIAINMDFIDTAPTSTPTFSGSSGTPWDTALWDTFKWGSPVGIVKNWQTVNGVGFAAALNMTVSAKAINVSWMATDFAFQLGAVL